MCCFSRPVEIVADTNIFARAADSRQFLVYSMKFKAGEDLAMILPIPTPRGSAEDAVKFISLEKYAEFFDDLKKGFPVPVPKSEAPSRSKPTLGAASPLAVVEVGNFIASFVPGIKDFDRLDERFRLPAGVWDKLPRYKEFGFAVFKLKKPEKGEQKVHPMAFSFPRASGQPLFFPTVHIHDGTVPAKAKFDHMLYCQSAHPPMAWEESPGLAGSFAKVEQSQGILDGNAHVYRTIMKGQFDNKDVAI